MVPQEGFLFDDTLLHNIRYGRPSASDADVELAITELGPGRLGRRPAAGPARPASGSAASRCRRGSGSWSPWPAPTWPTPTCWCSTRPPAPSTPPPRCGCSARSTASPPAAPPSPSRTGCRPPRWPTRSSWSTPGGWSRSAGTRTSSTPAASYSRLHASWVGPAPLGLTRPRRRPASAPQWHALGGSAGARAPLAPDLDPAVAARLKRDADGLVAAVVQQHDDARVLMVGWMDDEALHRTLTTGRVTFWSRSRQEYWRKGDTSGHVQHVRSVALDCDGDALLVRVDQVGAGVPHRQPVAASTTATWERSSAPPVRVPTRTAGDRHRRGSGTRARPGLARARRLPRAGPRPPGDPGRPPAARRRRDADRAVPQARPRPAGHVPAGVGRARRRLVAVLDRRGRARARPSPRSTGRRTGWASRRSACPPTAPALEALAGTLDALHTPRLDGLPPLTGGHGRRGRLRRRAALGAPARARRRRARRAGADDVARHRRRGARPRRRHAAAGGQRDQLRRHRRAGRRGLGRRRRPAGPDDRRGRGAGAVHGRGHRRPGRGAAARADAAGRVPGRRPHRPGGDPRRRGLPGRALAALRPGLPGRRARRLPLPARLEPEPVHVPAPLPDPGRHRPRRRRLQPGGAGEGAGRPGAVAPDRRHPAARGQARRRTSSSARTCWPTSRSAASTSCWSTSPATTWPASASRARSRSSTS